MSLAGNPALRKMVGRLMYNKDLRRRVFELDKYECVYCGINLSQKRVAKNRTIDHLAPLSTMDRVDMSAVCHPSNLVTACKSCNGELSSTEMMDKTPRFGRFRW